MKHQSKLTVGVSKWIINTFAIVCMLIIPVTSYSQAAPPPPGPGGSGGNPDSPLGVPFDDNMNLAFLLTGVVFAVVILKKMQKKKLAQLL